MNETATRSNCPTCARLARLLAGTMAVTLAAVALWYLVSRLAGALVEAPSALALFVIALVLSGASFVTRRLCGIDRTFIQTSMGRAVWLEPGLAWLFLGLAIATFPASGLGVAVFWVIFVLSEAEAWLRDGRTVLATTLTAEEPNAAPVPVVDHGVDRAASLADASGYQETAPMPTREQAASRASVARESETDLPEGVSLQLTRQQSARGELIHGTARVTFEPGQRTATLHVAFGDPLAQPPEVEVEPRTELEVEITCPQALAHGVRFDLRLREPAAERTEIVFDFEAYAGPAESAAA